jgi:hypothetical protein
MILHDLVSDAFVEAGELTHEIVEASHRGRKLTQNVNGRRRRR